MMRGTMLMLELHVNNLGFLQITALTSEFDNGCEQCVGNWDGIWLDNVRCAGT